MARIPEIIRRNPLSQVAAEPPQTGIGWSALADMAATAADFVKPAAIKQATEAGLKAVYRDASGKLQVKEKNVLGGELADAHNSAAHAKYLAQRNIDMSQTFTELAQKYEFDPAGFKSATDGYVRLLQEDEAIPAALKEDLLLTAQRESKSRFNGLYAAETDRTYRDADVNTKTHRDMLTDDYVNLYMGGDMEAAEAKLKEIEEVSRFRANAPYIRETPAETAAYLKGTRAAAKVAKLTQGLAATSGEVSISDELQAEIKEVLADPDLDPDTRRKLYVATQGRLKGVEANAIVDGLTNDGYEAKVRRAESSSNPNAANPNSSALGLHQFINSTWMENVRELQKAGGAEWANGLSNDDILDMRTDGAASTEVFNHFTGKNQATLAKNGLPVNDATTYMAHFFGAGGAVTVLSADPGAMIKDILPDVVAANPFMANMTANDAYNWAARKMTMKASDMAAMQTQIDLIDDTEVRGMASSALNEAFNMRRRTEMLSEDGYRDRLGMKDDTLTEQEIFEDHTLSDDAQLALSAALREQRKAQIEIQQTVAALNDGTTIWDAYDSTSRNKVDRAYKSLLGEDSPMSEPGQVLAGEIAVKAGFLPQSSFNAIRGAVNGNDPAALASSMEFLNQVIERQPNAIGMYDDGGVMNALADYRYRSGFKGAEEAAAKMILDRSPEMTAKRKNLSDAAKAASKNLKPADVTGFFSDRNAEVEITDPALESAVMTDYRTEFERAYIETADEGLAKNRALTTLARVYGPDEVTGSNRLMKFPPQSFYPASFSEPDWMSTQLQSDVSTYVYGDEFTKGSVVGTGRGGGVAKKSVDLENIVLMSDERTRSEVAAEKAPGYTVFYMSDDGILEQLPIRYYFDPTAAKAKDTGAQSEFDAGRQRAIDFQKNVIPKLPKTKGASLTGYPNP